MHHDNVRFDDGDDGNNGSGDVTEPMDDGEVQRVREQRRRQNKQRYGCLRIFLQFVNFFANIFFSFQASIAKRTNAGGLVTV